VSQKAQSSLSSLPSCHVSASQWLHECSCAHVLNGKRISLGTYPRQSNRALNEASHRESRSSPNVPERHSAIFKSVKELILISIERLHPGARYLTDSVYAWQVLPQTSEEVLHRGTTETFVNLSNQVTHMWHPDEYLACHMDLLTDTDGCISASPHCRR
jgi:hypothetical protein